MTTAFAFAFVDVVDAVATLLPLRRGAEKEADLREKDGFRSRVFVLAEEGGGRWPFGAVAGGGGGLLDGKAMKGAEKD